MGYCSYPWWVESYPWDGCRTEVKWLNLRSQSIQPVRTAKVKTFPSSPLASTNPYQGTERDADRLRSWHRGDLDPNSSTVTNELCAPYTLLNYSDPGNHAPPRTIGRIKGWCKCTCSNILDLVLMDHPYHSAVLSSLHPSVCFKGLDKAGAGPGWTWCQRETAPSFWVWRAMGRRERIRWKQRLCPFPQCSPKPRPACRATASLHHHLTVSQEQWAAGRWRTLRWHSWHSMRETQEWRSQMDMLSPWGGAWKHSALCRGTSQPEATGQNPECQQEARMMPQSWVGIPSGHRFRDQAGPATLHQWSPEGTTSSEGPLLPGNCISQSRSIVENKEAIYFFCTSDWCVSMCDSADTWKMISPVPGI